MPDFLFRLAPVREVGLTFDDELGALPGFRLAPVERVGLVLDAELEDEVVFRLVPFLRGPAGVSGSSNYLEVAFAAALQVVINHNFNRRPTVQILSPGSLLVSADVAHTDANQVRLNFNTPLAGLAVLTA